MEYEIRAVLHYFFLKKFSIPSAHAELILTYGEGCISRSGVRYWYNQFKEGRTDLNDLKRSGKPVDNDRIEEINAILDEHPFASARYISQTTSTNKSRVLRILKKELGLTKRYSRWVPHLLNEAQKKKRVELSKALLDLLSSLKGNLKATVITCDESWVYVNYPECSKWCSEGEYPPDIEKRMIQTEKVMIFASFNCRGIVYLQASYY